MIKTGFSFGYAVGHLSEVSSRLLEIGWQEGPMADRATTFGFVKWTKECEKTGLRPVYGVELGVCRELGQRLPVVDYWTFLATDRLRPLHDLIYLASADKRCHLTYEQAQGADPSLIIVAHERTLADRVNWERVYLGLTPATPAALYRAAKKKGARMLALPRNVYPRASDVEFYRVALDTKIPERKPSTQTYPQHIASDEEIAKSVAWFAGDVSDHIALRKEVLSSCTATLGKAELLSPQRNATLREMCVAGAAKLGIPLEDPLYAERLERELAMIREKNFDDYFYIIAELVAWAKDRMVVGPARGSSCGSLVCYLTGITAIDPLKHDLLFERFIDVTRKDLPDIDLDFSFAKRELVFRHAEELYGDRVARLGSVGLFATRSALNQVGMALRIPSRLVNAVAETAVKRMMGDSRKSSTIEDSLTETDAGKAMLKEHPESIIAGRLERHPHNASRHAAGLVATSKPVLDYVAIDARNQTAMCDKYDAEELNLLKIDVLGLTQLTIFEKAMELVGIDPVSGWHEQLPLDDSAAFEVLNAGKFCGVFQFEGTAMRALASQIRFESIDDIIAATALVRPGPMGSGQTEEWVQRRAGRKPPDSIHPLIEPYVRDTYGLVVYQEQVLHIGREVGDLSWAEVTALRKAMSRSLGKEFFDQFGDKWKAAAIRKGLPAEIAGKFWDDMCQFGMWAFNKSHSVAYAYVSYWCCWWKAHHQVEYAAACLDLEADPVKQIELLKELRAEGIDYVAVDPARSMDHWLPYTAENGKRVLLGPLSGIKGMGPAKMAQALLERKNGNGHKGHVAKMLENPKTPIDSLFPIRDRVAALYPEGLAKAKKVVTPTKRVEELVDGDEVVIIATPSRLLPKDENEPIKVAKRGGRYVHPSKSLVLFLRDDTGEILAKVSRHQFERVGKDMAERGKANKAIYAVRGNVDRGFRIMWVEKVKYLGDLE